MEFFSKKRIFTYNELYEFIEQKDNIKKTKANISSLTKNILTQYMEKEYIVRIKKNLYCAISFETRDIIPSKYEIASEITKKSFVGLHSAMEYYGYSNQVYNEAIVYSYKYKFNDFEFEGNTYRYKSSWTDEFIIEDKNVFVTSLERTIVDLIDTLKSYDDYEELRNYLDLVPAIKGDNILEILKSRDKQVLYNKVGYIIKDYIDQYLLTEDHLNELKKHITKSRKYIINEPSRLNDYNKEWHLYIFEH